MSAMSAAKLDAIFVMREAARAIGIVEPDSVRANRLEAENAKLREHAEAMAEELCNSKRHSPHSLIVLAGYRADFPKEK